MHPTCIPRASQVLLPTAFYLAVHVGVAEDDEPPIPAAQLVACALVVLGGAACSTPINPHQPPSTPLSNPYTPSCTLTPSHSPSQAGCSR